MKVKDHPTLSKEDGFVVTVDQDAYQKRLNQIKQRQRIDALEKQNEQIGSDLNNLKNTLDSVLRLLQENQQNARTNNFGDSGWDFTIPWEVCFQHRRGNYF